MQRKRNLFLTLVLMILCMGIHSIAASASDNLDGQIVDGSLLTHDIESKDTKVLMPQSLSDGGVSR